MSPAPTEQSPLARFVLFMICLGLVASFASGAWVYAVELPAQAHAQPPTNSGCGGTYWDGVYSPYCCDENGEPEMCHTNKPGDVPILGLL